MNKTKTNISVKTNTGSRRKVDIIAGDNGPYVSGDILDANATKQLVDNVAVTGDYNDLKNKPTIPNVAVVNLGVEDMDMSTPPGTIINQDKISQVCDLMDAGTFVMCNFQGGPIPTIGFWFLVPTLNGASLENVALFVTNLTHDPSSASLYNQLIIAGWADVTSRYVTSNTEP